MTVRKMLTGVIYNDKYLYRINIIILFIFKTRS